MPSFAGNRRCLSRIAAGLGLLAFAVGCTPRSSPPGPGALSSSGSGISFTLYHWQSGLRVLFVDNAEVGRGSTGMASTNSRVHTVDGYAGPETAGYKWHIESSNGNTAAVKINGKDYDLANGTVFVVKVQDGQAGVHQLKRDLSAVPVSGDACREFLQKDEEIRKLLGLPDSPK